MISEWDREGDLENRRNNETILPFPVCNEFSRSSRTLILARNVQNKSGQRVSVHVPQK